MNILIGTAIVWILSAVFVTPLAKALATHRLATADLAYAGEPGTPNNTQARHASIATQSYILADVLVMGIAGLIAGLSGYWFIGISTKAAGWPGILTFAAASFIGLGVRGHAA